MPGTILLNPANGVLIVERGVGIHAGGAAANTIDGGGATEIFYVPSSTAQLVLTDLEMPVMDGRQLIQEMADDAEWRHIPVAVVSAYEPENLALPHVAYLGKPVDFGRLLALVTEHCLG